MVIDQYQILRRIFVFCMEISDSLRESIISLPDSPGVYQYYDASGTILYVGKAKSLRKRVSSYFVGVDRHPGKTAILVRKIFSLKYILVDTELDALLLENNLIKKYQPKYNVMLKDDKTYPWICITNERFPRIFPTRKVIKDGSQYFGPYANVKVMYTMLGLAKKMYPLRNCHLNLSKENIAAKKFKVCLEFHIGNCLGPCEDLQTQEDYDAAIAKIRDLIKGNISVVIRQLKEEIKQHVSSMRFELAQETKEKLDALESYQSRSTVVSSSITNVDVFAFRADEKAAYVSFFRVIDGAIIQGHTIEMKKKIEESNEEMLQLAIVELRERFQSNAAEIIVPFELALEIPDVDVTVPQRGDKRKLVELCERNVDYYLREKHKQEALTDPERHTKRIMATMMKDLRLVEEPRLIECFDNSNFQGDFAVSAMTVFRDGKPSKKDYRHFNVKTVEGPDDFATMREVIHRRYSRVMEENLEFPQLLVVDGGKGQLSAAMEALDNLKLRGKFAVIGIAKRLEEIYYPDDPIPLYLDKKSETLRVIQYIRDEAHRFGITHHRKKRSKGTIKSELTEIEGISDVTAKKLLSKFKSVKQLKEKSMEEIAEVVGKAKAKLVWEYFHSLGK